MTAQRRYSVLYVKEIVNRGGGCSHYLVAQAKAMAKRGHRQIILTGECDLRDELEAAGVKVIIGPLNNDRQGLARAWRGMRCIQRVARSEKVDLIHAHHRWPGLLAWLGSRFQGVPVVSTDHLELYGNKRLSFRGEAVIAVSSVSKAHLMRYFGIPETKITVVPGFTELPEPVPEESIRSLKTELGLNVDDQIIGQVGRLHEQKGPDHLLTSFKTLHEKFPRLHLLMVGHGELAEQLRDQADSLGINDRVHWLGLRKDVPRVMSALDVLVLSSRYEGTPLTLVEAMALSRPIVSTTVGGIPDLLDHGECGVLVPPETPDAFAEAVASLLEDPERRKQLGDAAKNKVMTTYDHDILAGVLENVYENICSMRPVRW